jgi:mRNA interferase MazF
MSVRRGEVIWVDWPFSDRTGSKVRPAVVVQDDSLNGRIADTVLALITRSPRAVGTTEVLIDPAVETGSGLRHRSAVSCNNLLTIDQQLLHQTVGRLSYAAMLKIDAPLKASLGLP